MFRRHKRARLVIFTPIVAVFLGWFVLNPGRELVVTAYDMAVASSCGPTVEKAVDVFQAEAETIDSNQVVTTVAAQYSGAVGRLRASVDGASCPSFAKAAQADVVKSLDALIGLLDAVAAGRPLDNNEVNTAFARVGEELNVLRAAVSR